MIGGAGSVRGLAVMIATEGIFVWCAVTPASACKSSQVNTLPKAKSETRSKQNKDMHK
jgi:hypothetical protein